MIKRGLEVCSQCNEYPCKRFDSEKDGYDSFATHKKIFTNLDYIKANGIDPFIEQQKERLTILNELIMKFDDGRSKNFFCLCCALLPLAKLKEMYKSTDYSSFHKEAKERNREMKEELQKIADSMNVELRLKNKK